jgi:hypothetical protein
MSVKIFALVSIVAAALASSAYAGISKLSPERPLLIEADWQEPASLPPRFRNHCTIDPLSGRPYCSNHCGADYQFNFCSRFSFGCCHLGRGYCDGNGQLRCAPQIF